MIYAYQRVSTQNQILARQEEALNKYCEDNNVVVDKVFADKVSGKTFNREQYQLMRDTVQEGDIIIIKELDRFGRNMELIKEEWRYYMLKGVKIIVIDMPLISSDLSGKKTLDMQFISNLVFEVLCYSAEKEREKISQRVKEGLKCARERGAKIGREETYDEEKLKLIKQAWDEGYKVKDITAMYGISEARLMVIRKKLGWQPRNIRRSK